MYHQSSGAVSLGTLCMLNQFSKKILSKIPSGCHTCLDPDQARHYALGPGLSPNCLQRISVDYTSMQCYINMDSGCL